MSQVELIVCKDRHDWLIERQKGIGGSEAAAIMGLAPQRWGSPLSVFQSKVTEIPEEENEREQPERMRWGHRHEPGIAAEYELLTGRPLRHDGDFTIQARKDHTWMRATLDRSIISVIPTEESGLDFNNQDVLFDVQGEGVLEAKSTDFMFKEDWESEPPMHFQIQLQHSLMVTGRQWGSIAVLIGGNQFRWQDQTRNDNFIEELQTRMYEFWQWVERGIEPPADETEASQRAIQLLHPKDRGSAIFLPTNTQEILKRREGVKEAIKRLETIERRIDNQLKQQIGDHTFGVIPDANQVFSWKHQQRAAHAVKASEFRVLRVHKKRPKEFPAIIESDQKIGGTDGRDANSSHI